MAESEYIRKGKRKYPDDKGQLWLAEGEYGKGPDGKWYARPFGDHTGNLGNHDVTEHPDGTITVSPSILITGGNADGPTRWHGYLEKGVWRKLKE
jgi:hypothetical protein